MASLGIPLSRPVLVCRVAWMKRYQGVTSDDKPVGGGDFVRKNGYCGEVYNFTPSNGRYYGFVETLASKNGTPRTLNISKLGASGVDDFVDGATVFWVATNPDKGGQYVVGWYTNARVYRKRQEPQGPLATARTFQKDPSSSPEVFSYAMEANGQNEACVCLGLNEREYKIAKASGSIGQANVWYPNPEQKGKLLKWLNDYVSPSIAPPPPVHQTDTERRQRVEKAAIEAVKELYRSRGYYDVKDVSNKNWGWDLEAEGQGNLLRIETKGLSGPNVRAELTPNEYKAMTTKEGYRLCVVTEALNEMARRIHDFSPKMPDGDWQDSDGCVLKVDEQLGAIVTS